MDEEDQMLLDSHAKPGAEAEAWAMADASTKKWRCVGCFAPMRRFRKMLPVSIRNLCILAVMVLAAVLTIVLLATLTKSETAGIGGITVDLGYATYKGTTITSNGINQWLGIRYGAAPVGDLRFRVAKDPPIVDGIQNANLRGPICVGTSTSLPSSQSEDCLFLDVFAPTTANITSQKPVFVFIQGGGLNSNANSGFDGTGLIKASGDEIVVVTFGYRVGLYGFLASEEVEMDGDTNVGLKDQRKVFQWVQEHIHKFGGDPNHVTIGGDSAGAASVDLHLTAYDGRDDNLFHATAAESPSFGAQFDVAGSQYQYDALVARIGCYSSSDTLECLRSKTTAELQSVNYNIPSPGGTEPPIYMYSNVIDGDFTTNHTYTLFAEDKFVKVPSIWGDDTNGGTVFAPKMLQSVAEMNAFLKNNFPKLTDSQIQQVDAFYPKAEQFPNSGKYWRAASNAYGDMRYMCPGLYISERFSNSKNPVWNYRYNVSDRGSIAAGYGVKHAVEVNAIWGPKYVNGGAPPDYSITRQNANIVPIMMGYWTSFIRSYDPNTYRSTGTPVWEQFVTGQQNRILLETNTTRMEIVETELQTHCKYLSSIGAALQQ